jgi:hypothetical protein
MAVLHGVSSENVTGLVRLSYRWLLYATKVDTDGDLWIRRKTFDIYMSEWSFTRCDL